MKLAKVTTKALDNFADFWGAVEQARKDVIGEVLPTRPIGSFTDKEYADRFGVCLATAGGQIRRMMRQGKLTRVRAYGPTGASRMTPLWFYSPK